MKSSTTATIRTFIAIDLPAELKQEIASVQSRLKPLFNRAKVSWVKPENIHLTLKFLGDVLPSDIPKIIKACEGIKQKPIPELTIDRIGFFPGQRKPKVLWCGYDRSDALVETQRYIENALVPCGFDAEEKPFVSHLTLARIKEIGSRPGAPFYVDMDDVQKEIDRIPISFAHSVRGIKLIKSRLSPKGSEYSVLHEWSFQQSRL